MFLIFYAVGKRKHSIAATRELDFALAEVNANRSPFPHK